MDIQTQSAESMLQPQVDKKKAIIRRDETIQLKMMIFLIINKPKCIILLTKFGIWRLEVDMHCNKNQHMFFKIVSFFFQTNLVSCITEPPFYSKKMRFRLLKIEYGTMN